MRSWGLPKWSIWRGRGQGRQGDKGTRRIQNLILSPCSPISPSPHPPLFPSHLPLSSNSAGVMY
ncbi:hypothetical protein PI95_009800 [Hassallia byssoidea VB512170]|uniref:Uncharacterized protein n=1 Tax=Hassallia byssoidea VB512170 TaxID=1304833 RepID=A0A846H6D9_9CYAN|nr:hypothetical protein [Hassalia byssoidea]NEU72855.1 hypothetical protein [Hassalia byssoidea VB512170]